MWFLIRAGGIAKIRKINKRGVQIEAEGVGKNRKSSGGSHIRHPRVSILGSYKVKLYQYLTSSQSGSEQSS